MSEMTNSCSDNHPTVLFEPRLSCPVCATRMQQGFSPVEGVPPGTKLVRIGVPQVGEWVIDTDGSLFQFQRLPGIGVRPIIAPDNVYNVVDLMNVPIPDGYERDGDSPAEFFRMPKTGEWFVSANDGSAINCRTGTHGERIVLRRKSTQYFKITATADLTPDEYEGIHGAELALFYAGTGHRKMVPARITSSGPHTK